MNMKICTDRKLYKYIKASMLFVLVFVVCFYSGNKEAKAEEEEEDIITTHIWATNYNQTNHWEYCTLCGEIRENVEHVFTDNWYEGKPTCWPGNYNNRVCECGYSYVEQMEHQGITDWTPRYSRYRHIKQCTACTKWLEEEQCYDAEGDINCLNPGTCLRCGMTTNDTQHYLVEGGVCRVCKKQFVEISEPIITYAADYSTVQVDFTLKAVDPSVTLHEGMNIYSKSPNYESDSISDTWTFDIDEDQKFGKYSVVIDFDENKLRKSTITLGDTRDTVKVSGEKIYLYYTFLQVYVWQDHYNPEISEIVQVDQKTHDGWATIKELTIKGSDNLAHVINLSIYDKETNEYAIKDAKVTVGADHKFEYKCTPPLEGPIEGRKYVCVVEDETGNKLEHEFMIYKTDSKHPAYASETEFTTWSQTKNLEFLFSDYGAGGVETSLNNQVSYVKSTKTNDNYVASYTFAEENYGVTKYSLYMRDGLGNAGRTYVTVGRIDNTRPSIVDAVVRPEGTRAVVEVTGDDFSRKMNAQGSGVAYYALADRYVVPAGEQWQMTNEITVTKPGRYYLWVKDLVGNISDALIINIDDSYNGNITDKIIYDRARIEDDIIERYELLEEINHLTNKVNVGLEEKKEIYNPLLSELDELDDTPATQII